METENLYFDHNGESKLVFLDSLKSEGVLQDYKVRTVKASPNGQLTIEISAVLWPEQMPNIEINLDGIQKEVFHD